MKDLIRFVKIDILVQQMLFFLVCASVIVFFYLPVTLCLLGAWQLFSAVVIRRKIEDDARKKYLISSGIHLALMGGVICYMIYGNSQADSFLFFLFFLFLFNPVFLAIWYYVISKHTLEDLERERIIEMPETMNLILDSEEIFKPIEK